MTTETISHADLVTLTAFLASTGYSAESVAYAVEKPHKYEPERRLAVAILDHENANPGHTCRPDAELDWYCDAPFICGWKLACTCTSPGIGTENCTLHRDAP